MEAAGKAAGDAAERAVSSVKPEQWNKLVVCVLIDALGSGSYLIPGLGEAADAACVPSTN